MTQAHRVSSCDWFGLLVSPLVMAAEPFSVLVQAVGVSTGMRLAVGVTSLVGSAGSQGRRKIVGVAVGFSVAVAVGASSRSDGVIVGSKT